MSRAPTLRGRAPVDEARVLKLIAEGLSHAVIAIRVGCSPRHVGSIIRKHRAAKESAP